MSKKIIALSLAILLIVTCFVACGKKYETTIINGEEVVLVTDENGNPVLNAENQLIALVTDNAGEIIKYDDGEDQTRYIKIIDAIEIDGLVHGEKYKFNLLSGWKVGNDNRVYKENTENKCYYHFVKVKEMKGEESLDAYLEKIDNDNDLLVDGFKQKGFTLTTENGGALIGNGSTGTDVRKYKITDANGNVTHYAESYYFVKGTTIYAISYVCEDGKGYDANFDFAQYLKTDFTYID